VATFLFGAATTTILVMSFISQNSN
jgi:hypothetical protein